MNYFFQLKVYKLLFIFVFLLYINGCDKMSKKHNPKKLNKDQASILLNQEKWVKDIEASDYLTTPVFYNKNKEVLVVFVWDNNSGMLYYNKDDFLKMIYKDKDSPPKSIFYESFQFGPDFLDKVPQMIKEISGKFNIDQQLLDFSLDSIDIFEKSLFKLGRKKCLSPKFFPYIVSYVGEVIRKKTGGVWKIVFVKETKMWEPWIENQENQKYDLFGILKYSFDEENKFNNSVLRARINTSTHKWH